MVNCLLCDASIDVDEDELDEGDLIQCDECGASLRVSGTGPLEFETDDDSDDDDDFDEDDDDEDDDEDDEFEEDDDFDEDADDEDADEESGNWR